MQKYKNLLFFAIFCSLSISLNANTYKESLAGIIGKNIVLKSELKKHEALLKILVSIKKKKNISLFSLNDVLLYKLQFKKTKKANVIADLYHINKTFEEYPKSKNLTMSEFEIFIKKYNLDLKDVNAFVKENHILEKMHEKMVDHRVIVSRDDLHNFITYTNKNDIPESLFKYKIVKISFKKRTDNRINLINIKKVIDFIKSENIKDNMSIYLKNAKLWIKIEILNFKPSYELERQIGSNFSNIRKDGVLGPFYFNGEIILTKIMEKVYDVKRDSIKVRVGYIRIKKNSSDVKNQRFNPGKKQIQTLNKLRQRLQKKNIKSLKIAWLNDLKVPFEYQEKLKNFNTNDVSDVIETYNSWFIIKVLYKEFDITDQPNSNLYAVIKRNKFLKLRKIWINNLTKKVLIKRFNEKEIKKKIKSEFFNK